jgi:hypothetical protein
MAFNVPKRKMKEKKAFDPSTVPVYYLEGDYGLTPEQEIQVWQHNVDNGMVWKLQGWYGRTATDMLNAGVLKYPKKRTHDYYGNPIPTQKEAKQGHFDKE